jgi:hypothetical protein
MDPIDRHPGMAKDHAGELVLRFVAFQVIGHPVEDCLDFL